MFKLTVDHLIAAHILARVPILLRGIPAIGKTDRISQIGKAMGRPVVETSLARYLPEDIGGYPRPDDTNRVVDMFPLRKLACVPPNAILFLDEFGDVDRRKQAVSQQLLYERRLGDIRLPDGVSIVCAGNPSYISADGYDLAPTVASRLGQYDFPVPSIDEWVDWAAGKASESAKYLSKVNYNEFTPQRPSPWLNLIGAFFRVKPDLFCAFPKKREDQSKPWPSPRTWELTAKIWEALSFICGYKEPVLGSDGCLLAELAAASCVGPAAAVVFRTWVNDQSLPNIRDLLEGKISWKPKRLDEAYSCAVSLLNLLRKEKTEQIKDDWDKSWKVISEWIDDYRIVVAYTAKELIDIRDIRWPIPMKNLGPLAPMLKQLVSG